MDKFCLITNRDKDINLEITTKIVEYMKKNKKNCKLLDGQDPICCNNHFTDTTVIEPDTECAIVVGGDGTIIQAANDLLDKGLPILGINLGTLGFLAEIEKHNLYEALDALFRDKCSFERRMMLTGSITRDKEEVDSGVVLNDIVITRSGFSRIISVSIYINDELVDRYRGDGVVISTPTGSTGYNLSAGGPVVKPDAKMVVITPICPHTLSARSIVVSSTDEIRVQINESKKTQEDEAIATFDGRMAFLLRADDMITINQAREETKLVKINQKGFFGILRTKIGQGGE
ncbi:NAD kinase [Anaerocolumna cellulosilytica]|uniref:NAD kinase n=1 Tax=Anaerocolumna cellulosilytica TaxID=433286 RepID=A0A6S6R6S3_9FIRM|nr:NAD(+)/NADH kinase [Anaerocolumna cellulosilytica]MBB5196607.1 NAD+ kinase [Anaerocolumna cellulosilytica]BCJ95707.1 NAD kinase [Anaerocolumna cellulosilytica]